MIAGVERTDRELVVTWMRNDWADNLYEGASNAEGRKALEGELLAMLDLEDGGQPLVEPNWALVEDCRRILARLSVADRAYQLLKSQARQAVAPDWVAARHGGPDFATVFETTTGDSVESVVVPGFFTYAGFQSAFIGKLPTIADQLQRDNWVLGDAGKLGVITSQFDNLTRDLLTLYNEIFSRPGNKPSRSCECGLSTSASRNTRRSMLRLPLRRQSGLLIDLIRDETVLTRERKEQDKDNNKTAKKELAPSLLSGQSGVPAQISKLNSSLSIRRWKAKVRDA